MEIYFCSNGHSIIKRTFDVFSIVQYYVLEEQPDTNWYTDLGNWRDRIFPVHVKSYDNYDNWIPPTCTFPTKLHLARNPDSRRNAHQHIF